MKKVISGEELKNKTKEAINLLCDSVKITLGPKGSNVIVDHSNFNPFITNDGVTIAQNIESDDQVINTILEIAKESSIKTNEKVGDGTTSTLVLLESIFNQGLKAIENGKNPLCLKKEIDIELERILKYLEKSSYKPNQEQLFFIASTSANDEEIGNLISECYQKVRTKNAITITESNESKSCYQFLEGYSFSTMIASPYFFKDNNEIILKNTYILLINDYLDSVNYIEHVINKIVNEEKSLIVIALDYSDNFINEILALNFEQQLNIVLLKNPEYGIKQYKVFKDLSLISRCPIYKNENIKNYLGNIEKITINNNLTTINFKQKAEFKKYVENDFDYADNELDTEFYYKRLAMFESGMIEIKVGAPTSTERREKKMRFDDALFAVNIAFQGVTAGSGVSLMKISNQLNNSSDGSLILKEALKEPFKQIMVNSALDYEKIMNEIIESNFTKIFNVSTNSFELIEKTSVLDPIVVIKESLINACSIATMLLTTSSMVINEHKLNNDKSEYFDR